MKYVVAALMMLASHAHADSNQGANTAETAIVAKLAENGATTGRGASILFWSDSERRVGFREIDQINPTREISTGAAVYVLTEKPTDLSNLTYIHQGTERRVQDFLDRPESIGLIVVHKDQIIFERYQSGNDKASRWISFSVTKSVTSMLIGAAIQDGYIESVDEPIVNYLPRLRGTGYEQATIKDILQMSSGVAWNEDYADPDSDVAHAGGLNGLALVQYLGTLKTEAEPGKKWNYNTGETNLVGQVLRAAIANNAATYLTRKIWQPFGMEFDASWTLDSDNGDELGGCCINATLRDYARLGIFAMQGGKLKDGTQVLPENWMLASTAPAKGYAGYGYLWWLQSDGTYSARGIFGQNITIDPANELVIAMHNSAPAAVDTEFHDELGLVIEAIKAHIQK
jgi:CubicO group peptidase (beta-lactamase class C family)